MLSRRTFIGVASVMPAIGTDLFAHSGQDRFWRATHVEVSWCPGTSSDLIPSDLIPVELFADRIRRTMGICKITEDGWTLFWEVPLKDVVRLYDLFEESLFFDGCEVETETSISGKKFFRREPERKIRTKLMVHRRSNDLVGVVVDDKPVTEFRIPNEDFFKVIRAVKENWNTNLFRVNTLDL